VHVRVRVPFPPGPSSHTITPHQSSNRANASEVETFVEVETFLVGTSRVSDGSSEALTMRSHDGRSMIRALLCCIAMVLLRVPSARAEEAQPTAADATTGYELVLHGNVTAELGEELHLFGVAYLVDGLATLRPGSGLVVDARITVLVSDRQNREVVSRSSTTAGADGRFTLAVPIEPRDLAAPRLELIVHRRGESGRSFNYDLQTRLPHVVDLLTDRQRYQPGEKVRVWSRVTSIRDRSPLEGASVRLTLVDQDGRPVAERTARTSAAGVVSTEIELPDSAQNGSWRVRADVIEGGLAPEASRDIEVTRRTVERLQASVALDQDLVQPGGELTGRVTVRSPSGSPVRGARVEIVVRGSSEPLVLTSGADGVAQFRTQAPAYLAGDVGGEQVEARVVHPAHGTIAARASYLLARIQWVVEATQAGGAAVPEVDSEVFLHVHDPRGRPIGAGTKLRISGLGLPGGATEVETDARGLAVVEVRLPRGAASRRDSGPCSGQVATTLEVEVESRPPVTSRLCVRVAPEAQVRPRAARAVVEPGAEVEVGVQRRPAVAHRPVLVEAVWSGRAVAWAWIDGARAEGTLRLPPDIQGVVQIRARPVMPADQRRPLDEPGATALATGASAAVLVRPADAFALTVEPDHELWRVRERARVSLRASRAPGRAWAALVARDEAAHGGEPPWDLHWIQEELREAAAADSNVENDRFLRTALAAVAPIDGEQPTPPPLIVPPWQHRRSGSYDPRAAAALGVLRDPVARREELLRRGLAPVMRALEAAVAAIGADEASRRGVVRRAGARVEFDPEVIQTLIDRDELNETVARTLGGEAMTVEMISTADPSFTFDSVARRVARGRLVALLGALQQLADPDNPDAARASAGVPPERWLSTLVQLGMIEPDDLIDPWGRSFAFRRAAAGREPAVVVSDRALGYELVSPGPDGALGSADDVRDPFARAVDAGTPYAVASGEDDLMERLSRIAPGPRVLQAMVQAYGRLGLAASEERSRGPVEANASEDDMEFARDEAADAEMEEGVLLRSRAARLMEAPEEAPMGGAFAPPPPPARPAAPQPVATPMSMEPEPAFQNIADAGPGQSVGVMAQMIREDFPATLFFLAETPIDAQGLALVELPLADALTTYRLEAISWTGSGWVVSAAGSLRVDQEAMVDAPVPPYATVGDMIRLPVRVANRTAAPLTARIEIASEGDLALRDVQARQVEVPPFDAVEELVDVRFGTVGTGAIVIGAVRADSGQPLDAVRRPVEVLEDARLARESREVLLETGDRLRVEVPAEASDRGPGELRLAVGNALFGDPAEWAGDSLAFEDTFWAGWALTVAEGSLPEPMVASLLRQLPDDADGRWYWAAPDNAAVLSTLWGDDRFSDEVARCGLQSISELLPAESATDDVEVTNDEYAWTLLALGPAITRSDQRPDLAEDLARLADRLRGLVSSQAARATDAPEIWVLAAAALAHADRGNARALEMLRRASRHVIEVGDEAWLEPPTTDGTAVSRVEPTALMALARLALDQDREDALSLIRSLVRVVRGADRWPVRARALVSAAASRLATSPPTGQVQVLLDGVPVEVRREEGVVIVPLDGIGRPGTHVVEVRMAAGEVALAWLDLRYGLPWNVVPRREAPVEIEWTGPAGVRDGRAGLRLSVRNRGARILTRPIVEIEVPAGVELDEPTRERLSGLLAAPATFEGRTVRLQLRPLAPGGYVRIPLPFRWSLGGTLIGLGTTVWDDTGPASLQDLPARVLPSRGVEVADRGEEPEQPEAEASPPPLPPPPPPICPLDPLGLEEVTR